MDRYADASRIAASDQGIDGGALRPLAVLWALAGSEVPLTLNEVAAALAVPRTSAHRILQSLVTEGWANAAGRPKRYAPSWKVVELGFRAARQQRVRQVLVETAMELVRAVAAPVFFGFYEHGDVVFTDWIDVRGERIIPHLIQTRFPAALTAYGRVLLAYQPADEIERALSADVSRYSNRNPLDRTELEAALQQIRERGFDINQRGRDPGIAGIAVPVFEGHNRPAASLGVRLVAQPPDDQTERLIQSALAAARNASADLHHAPSIFP